MQKAVIWWCNLIGVTDLSAIQTATGIASVLTFAVVVVLIWAVLISAVNGWSGR